jgi:hypothetical protein
METLRDAVKQQDQKLSLLIIDPYRHSCNGRHEQNK